MPSLEIICLNQSEPRDFSHMPFHVDAERELVSHRGPAPLFQADFDKLKGCIYHLTDEKGPTAYDLLKQDWYGEEESDDNVEFREELAPHAKSLLEQLLSSSPIGQILFTTDYQFGPEGKQKHGPVSFAEFWQTHNAGKIRMNASYLIKR